MEQQIVLNCWSVANFHCLDGCKLQHLANCLSTLLGKEEERVNTRNETMDECPKRKEKKK